MDHRYRILTTELGHVGFVATDRGLRRVFLPSGGRADLRRAVRTEFPAAAEDDRLLPGLAADLRAFFAGEAVEFDARCDWRGYTTFEADVWRACRMIRYGRTRTYGELAERVGRPGGARAIGMAMSRNPCPIVVPCHRVLRSDGSLGGYSGPGGVDFKQRLLEMESAAATARA